MGYKKMTMPSLSGEEKNRGTAVQEIPNSLVYEEIDFRQIYYQGYKEVLSGSKTLEQIMGSSSLQASVIRVLLKFLYRHVDGDGFEVYTNETGLHIEKGSNLSADIAVFNEKDIARYEFDDNYFIIPPEVSIEVDIKADLSNIKWEVYLKEKNSKLHDWGVKKVIWILTASRQIIIAEPDQDWAILEWTRTFPIVANHQICLSELLSSEQ